jgi:hypothetical protein
MNRRIKKKYDERGRLKEILQTSVFGLVFESRITFEHDAKGNVILETDWHDMKTIKATRRYNAVNGKQTLVEVSAYSREGELLSRHSPSPEEQLVVA